MADSCYIKPHKNTVLTNATYVSNTYYHTISKPSKQRYCSSCLTCLYTHQADSKINVGD
jgi:hypothetical protein